MDVLCFDIETIPTSEDKLTDVEKLEFRRRWKAELRREFPGGCSYTEAKKNKSKLMATSFYTGEIIVIGTYARLDGQLIKTAITGTEEEILKKFWEGLKNFKGMFVSFNGLKFDIPFIIRRSLKHNIKPTNNDFLELRRYSQYPHYDVKQIITDWDKFGYGTLELVTSFLGIPSPKNAMKAEDVAGAFAQGKIDEIVEYCMKDVEATYAVFQRLRGFTHSKGQ